MINLIIKEQQLVFKTSKEVFSPKNVDKGTMSMLSFVEIEKGDKILDLGCGYGIVGILVAKFIEPENV